MLCLSWAAPPQCVGPTSCPRTPEVQSRKVATQTVLLRDLMFHSADEGACAINSSALRVYNGHSLVSRTVTESLARYLCGVIRGFFGLHKPPWQLQPVPSRSLFLMRSAYVEAHRACDLVHTAGCTCQWASSPGMRLN